MSLTVRCTAKIPEKADTIVVGVFKDNKLTTGAEGIDLDNGGLIKRYLERQKSFTGKVGQVAMLSPESDSSYIRIVLLGLGAADKLDEEACEKAGGDLFKQLKGAGAENTVYVINAESDKISLDSHEIAAHLALGTKLRSYSFDKYKTQPDSDPDKGDNDTELTITLVTDDKSNTETYFTGLDAIANGIFLARDLVNEPPNELYPDSFAEIIRDQLKPLGVEVEIFDEKKLDKLGFSAHLTVGMGSSRPPRLVVMRWNGSGKTGKKSQPAAFVGKGVTFDTGGINLKPSSGMESMKLDMGGAATVVGLMKTLALRKAKTDVIGVVGLAENMPSSNAYRPSDVIKTLSGKTVEVMNTDAEGRLILIDCLTYIQQHYKPSFIIDLATLTGAMMVALGHEYCGTFVNDDTLWDQLARASGTSHEKLWRMPLDETYRKEMDSTIADVRSLGSSRYAGACTAAAFLERFVDDGVKWAHMDIAGVAWIKKDTATAPKPASGFGVRVLNNLLAENYE